MSEPTDKEIDDCVKNCYWRNTDTCLYDGDEIGVICKTNCEPCVSAINAGKCDALIELFKEHH